MSRHLTPWLAGLLILASVSAQAHRFAPSLLRVSMAVDCFAGSSWSPKMARVISAARCFQQCCESDRARPAAAMR